MRNLATASLCGSQLDLDGGSGALGCHKNLQRLSAGVGQEWRWGGARAHGIEAQDAVDRAANAVLHLRSADGSGAVGAAGGDGSPAPCQFTV